MKISQPIDLGTTSKWEVGVCEISCSSSPEGASPVLLYCNLIIPQFLGDSTVRCIRTFQLYHKAICQHDFRNVQYVPVEQRIFQDIRIKFVTIEGLQSPSRTALFPRKWCFISARITSDRVLYKHGVGCHNRTFITMHPLETHYLNQAGSGLPSEPGIGPIYSAPLYLQRGMGSATSWAISFVSYELLCGPWAVQVARSSPM